MIFESRYPPVLIRDITVTERVFEGLDTHPDDAVLIDGLTRREVTAAELKDRIQRFAGALIASGYGGETVALMSTNHTDDFVVIS